MKLWRIYKTEITSIRHKIADNPYLTEESRAECLKEHMHEHIPVTVELKLNGWWDFKEIKARVETILQGYNGDIGVMDMETMITAIYKQICSAFGFIGETEDVRVTIQETHKYGVKAE